MNGKPTSAAVAVAILSVAVATMGAYMVATSNVDAKIASRVKEAQAPVLLAVERLSQDVREVRSILLGTHGRNE